MRVYRRALVRVIGVAIETQSQIRKSNRKARNY